MAWVNVVSIGASVIGGVVANKNAKKAATAQVQSAEKASETEMKMLDQNREDMKPWRDAGTMALSQMLEGTKNGGEFNRNFSNADFVQDPGYQFRMQQGMEGLERSAAARGGALSGGALKDITRYGQNFASNEYSNAYNRFNNDLSTRFGRLSSIAGTGQTSTAQVGQMGAQVANSVGNNMMGAGNARASGYVAQANAATGTAQTLGNYFMNQQLLNSMPSPKKGGTPGAQNVVPLNGYN